MSSFPRCEVPCRSPSAQAFLRRPPALPALGLLVFAVLAIVVGGTGCTSSHSSSPHARVKKPGPTFAALVFAAPEQCCPSCEKIRLTVRNTGERPLEIDWARSRFSHNGADVEVLPEDETGPTAIPPHAEWSGKLLPPTGAPNPGSLEEGKFRNGRWRIDLALFERGRLHKEEVTLDLDYAAAIAEQEEAGRLPTECEVVTDARLLGRGRPAGWPEPAASEPAASEPAATEADRAEPDGD